MSKYSIEIPDDVQYVLLNGKTDNKYYTAVRPVAELEVLNSDYINEHYGQMQDEAYQKGINDGSLDVKQRVEGAYQRGLEDGKKSIDKGCEGCRYASRTAIEEPCKYCSNCHTSKYEPLPERDDSIKVGDEVEAPRGKAVVTAVKDDLVYYFYSDGDLGCVKLYRIKKTGKHYDIASILEAMRE